MYFFAIEFTKARFASGSDKGGSFVEAKVRKKFADTLVYRPSVVTRRAVQVAGRELGQGAEEIEQPVGMTIQFSESLLATFARRNMLGQFVNEFVV